MLLTNRVNSKNKEMFEMFEKDAPRVGNGREQSANYKKYQRSQMDIICLLPTCRSPQFRRPYMTKEHMLVKHGLNIEYACNNCDYSFDDPRGLSFHQYDQHGSDMILLELVIPGRIQASRVGARSCTTAQNHGLTCCNLG